MLSVFEQECPVLNTGVVLNMRGVALGCMGDLRKAAESYQAAADICEEYEDTPNWAVAQANRGTLASLRYHRFPRRLICSRPLTFLESAGFVRWSHRQIHTAKRTLNDLRRENQLD